MLIHSSPLSLSINISVLTDDVKLKQSIALQSQRHFSTIEDRHSWKPPLKANRVKPLRNISPFRFINLIELIASDLSIFVKLQNLWKRDFELFSDCLSLTIERMNRVISDQAWINFLRNKLLWLFLFHKWRESLQTSVWNLSYVILRLC